MSSVVLLHSSAASARQWDALARTLAERFDVHAIDLHGHGARAPWHASAPLTLADEAALLEPVLERGRVHLVGHSYGGAVALDVARRHPHAVASVAVFEPVLFGCLFADGASAATARSVRELAAAIRQHVAAGHDAAAAERFVDFWSGGDAWAGMAAPQRASIARRMASVALHFDAAFAAADPRPALADAGLPLLCLAGERTVAPTRRIAQLLAASLPHAEQDSLAAMGHMGPLTHSAAVNRRITDFLARQVEPARRPAAFLAPETTFA
jgi:pimeloyl-ACP methyl ester carboxylesterase